jgi:hypothetical protein
MAKGKYMTDTELRLYKEKTILDYKLQHQAKQKNKGINQFLDIIKAILPLNIALGLLACIILVVLDGWNSLLRVFLTSVIWITLASTIIGAIVGKK